MFDSLPPKILMNEFNVDQAIFRHNDQKDEEESYKFLKNDNQKKIIESTTTHHVHQFEQNYDLGINNRRKNMKKLKPKPKKTNNKDYKVEERYNLAKNNDKKREDPARIKRNIGTILKRPKADGNNGIVACLRSKNYTPYLAEWIAFHYALGIDEFRIYDDMSIDNPEQVLSHFIEAGIVHLNKFNQSSTREKQFDPLRNCYRYYYNRRNTEKSHIKWISFNDPDEFLYPVEENEYNNSSIRDVLKKYSSLCCVKVGRIQFGSNGHVMRPPGLVLNNYIMQANKTNMDKKHVPSNPKMILNLHPDGDDSKPAKSVYSMHRTLDSDCDCTPSKYNIKDLMLNHYLRSYEDFFVKINTHWKDFYHVNSTEYKNQYQRRNYNDIENKKILKFVPQTEKAMNFFHVNVEETQHMLTIKSVLNDMNDQEKEMVMQNITSLIETTVATKL